MIKFKEGLHRRYSGRLLRPQDQPSAQLPCRCVAKESERRRLLQRIKKRWFTTGNTREDQPALQKNGPKVRLRTIPERLPTRRSGPTHYKPPYTPSNFSRTNGLDAESRSTTTRETNPTIIPRRDGSLSCQESEKRLKSKKGHRLQCKQPATSPLVRKRRPIPENCQNRPSSLNSSSSATIAQQPRKAA